MPCEVCLNTLPKVSPFLDQVQQHLLEPSPTTCVQLYNAHPCFLSSFMCKLEKKGFLSARVTLDEHVIGFDLVSKALGFGCFQYILVGLQGKIVRLKLFSSSSLPMRSQNHGLGLLVLLSSPKVFHNSNST